MPKKEVPKKSAEKMPLTERMGGTMNLILAAIGIALTAFTVAMIWLFWRRGAVPDTLITAVFGVLGGECGIMGWIKTTKERRAHQPGNEQREKGERA